MSRLGFRFSQCSGWVGVFLLLLTVAQGDRSVFLFSRLKRDETILPCLCLKTMSIWRPLRTGSCQRVRDPSRLWPALILAHHTSSGLSLTARIRKHPFCLLCLFLSLLLLSHLSRVRLCATPKMAAHQVPPSLGFSRQEVPLSLPSFSPPQGFQRSSPAGSLLKVPLVCWSCHEKQKYLEPLLMVVTFLGEVRHWENG